MGLQISTEYWILWILDIRTSLRFKKCHSEYASNILKSATRHTLYMNLKIHIKFYTLEAKISQDTTLVKIINLMPQELIEFTFQSS